MNSRAAIETWKRTLSDYVAGMTYLGINRFTELFVLKLWEISEQKLRRIRTEAGKNQSRGLEGIRAEI